MGSTTIPTRGSGVVYPDHRLAFWPTESGVYSAAGARESALGQASPRAGLPSPDLDTDLALRATGEQTESVDVYCNRAGLPVLDEMGYLVRADGGADADWQGCDVPVPLGGHQSVTGNDQRYTPHVIALGPELSDYAAITIYRSGTGQIYTRRVVDSGAWGAEVTVSSVAVTDPYPCLLRLPTTSARPGRILAFRWGDSSGHQVYGWYSDDDGGSWTALGPVLRDSVSSTTYPVRRRLRAVYLDGVIGLFAHLQTGALGVAGWRDRIAQWASSDGGYTFDLVTISDGSDAEHTGGYIDLAVWRGEIVFARLTENAGGFTEFRIRRLASPWYPWTAGVDLFASGASAWGQRLGLRSAGPGAGELRLTEGELALWVDDDSALYVASRHCTGAQDGASPVVRSANGGSSWSATGSSLVYAGLGQVWHWLGAAGVEAYGQTACAIHGHSVMVYSTESVHIGSDRLYAAWLGGWQDVPMPCVGGILRPTRRVAWYHSGVASHRPDEQGWTRTAVGAPVETLTPGTLAHTCGAGSTLTYSRVPTGTLAQGVITEHALEVTGGTALIRILLQDATPRHFYAHVIVSAATVQLWDAIAGAGVGVPWAYSGGPLAIRISMAGSTIAVYARAPGIALSTPALLSGQSRDWTLVASTNALAAGGGAAANVIDWSTNQNSAANWYWWPYVSDAYCGDHLYNLTSSDKLPRSLIESPSSAIRSVRLSAVTGPAAVGDRWQIDQSADYPYAAVLPTVEPSPRHPWRCDGSAGGDQLGVAGPTGRLSYQLYTTSQSHHGAVWGVLLDGLSMGGASVYLYYGGAWVLAGSVGYWGATATLQGRSLLVTAGGPANAAVLRRDELAGCLVDFTNAAGNESLERRICVKNDPGHIDSAAGASLPLRLELDQTPGVASPATIRIYPRRALLLIDMALHATEIRGVQLRWPIPRHVVMTPVPVPGPSPLGYHEVATLAAGPFWPLTPRHDWGRRLSVEADTELITAEDGTRTAYTRSPARRRVTCTWGAGVPMLDVLQQTDPDVIAWATGKPALAFARAAPQDLQDILRRLAGAATPIVWVESADFGGTGRPDHWADGAFVGRLTSAVDRDLMVGDEERDATERVQELVVEEEV